MVTVCVTIEDNLSKQFSKKVSSVWVDMGRHKRTPFSRLVPSRLWATDDVRKISLSFVNFLFVRKYLMHYQIPWIVNQNFEFTNLNVYHSRRLIIT